MKMKRTTLLTSVLAFAITISVIMTAQAEPFMGGKRGHGPGGDGFGGMRVLMQLDLSQDQKQSIYDILQKYKDAHQSTRASLMAHKEDLFDMTADGDFNEENIRQAFQESVPAMEDAVVLRTRINSVIKAVLTEEQLDELQQIKAEHAGRRQGKENKELRHAMLETWLTMDSE
jgi:Spy/CpxP family protein refolding chaperone